MNEATKPQPKKFRRVVETPRRPGRGRPRIWGYGYPELATLLGMSQVAVRQAVFMKRFDPGDLVSVATFAAAQFRSVIVEQYDIVMIGTVACCTCPTIIQRGDLVRLIPFPTPESTGHKFACMGCAGKGRPWGWRRAAEQQVVDLVLHRALDHLATAAGPRVTVARALS